MAKMTFGPPPPGNGNSNYTFVDVTTTLAPSPWVHVTPEFPQQVCAIHKLTDLVCDMNGVTRGKCINCHVLVEVPEIPGGISEVRLQNLIERYLALVKAPNPARLIASSDILGDFASLARDLEEQLRSLAAVKITMETFRRRLVQLAMPVIE